uniref:Uncharacterized protein n=1 Tax=Cacopsylla melanoneura TaxID=428564 RepID=A0A8D8RRK9_9HEMI
MTIAIKPLNPLTRVLSISPKLSLSHPLHFALSLSLLCLVSLSFFFSFSFSFSYPFFIFSSSFFYFSFQSSPTPSLTSHFCLPKRRFSNQGIRNKNNGFFLFLL